MKKLITAFLSISTFVLWGENLEQYKHIYAPQVPWLYMDFDQAMKRDEFPEEIKKTQSITGIAGDDFLNHCRGLYDLYNPSIQMKHTERIPRIIHQIWVGKAPLPEVFKYFMKSWTEFHMGRDWSYKLWTDEDLVDFVLENQALYDTTDNVGVKSDLLRYEILNRFGGIYIDTDFECLQPLDIFLGYDLFTALQPLDTGFVQLGIALIGCVPGHPILKHCIETIKDDWHRRGATAKTGPIHFTKSFYLLAGKDDLRDIAFPAHYFYPQGCKETELFYDKWIKQGSYAIHHWAKSWMPMQYRRLAFRACQNQEACVNWDK